MKRIINPWLNHDAYHCFGCCDRNESGVKMEFYADGEEVVSYWKPESRFQGWIDTLHGGIQAVLLDEICGWAVMLSMQTSGVTSKMETRYKHAVSTNNAYLKLQAKVTEIKWNIATVEASLYNEEGVLCTQAVCTYFTFPKEKSSEMGFNGFELEDNELDEDTIVRSLTHQ